MRYWPKLNFPDKLLWFIPAFEHQFNIILPILADGRCSGAIVLLILPITPTVACNSVFIGSLHPARSYVPYEIFLDFKSTRNTS